MPAPGGGVPAPGGGCACSRGMPAAVGGCLLPGEGCLLRGCLLPGGCLLLGGLLPGRLLPGGVPAPRGVPGEDPLGWLLLRAVWILLGGMHSCSLFCLVQFEAFLVQISLRKDVPGHVWIIFFINLVQ